MEAEGIASSAISAFQSTFDSLVSGNTGIIPESSISPSPDLVDSDSITVSPDTALLSETVVLKLNGGLGTGMGLDKAKSLLKVKGDDTFLDLTAKQVKKMREDYGFNVKFMLMNSFSTSEDTLDFFAEKYPDIDVPQYTVGEWEGRLIDGDDYILIRGPGKKPKQSWFKLKAVNQILKYPTQDLGGMDIMCFDERISLPERGPMKSSGFCDACK